MLGATRSTALLALATALALLAPVASANADLDVKPNPVLQDTAESWAAIEGKMLGGISLEHPGPGGTPMKLKVGYTDVPLGGGGDTLTENHLNGDFSYTGPICRIAINHGECDALNLNEKHAVIAHEVFHCYEHAIDADMDTPGGQSNEASWITEGLARWADLTLLHGTGPSVELDDLRYYVDHPKTNLFEESYPAAVFWGHLQDVTGDLWHRIPAIVRAGVGFKSAAAYAAALGGQEAEVLTTLGSSVLNLQNGDKQWQIYSPLSATHHFTPEYPSATTSERTGETLGPHTFADIEVDKRSDKPVVHIHIGPTLYGLFGVDTNLSPETVNEDTFCSQQIKDCEPKRECPEDTEAEEEEEKLVRHKKRPQHKTCAPLIESAPSCATLLPEFEAQAEPIGGEWNSSRPGESTLACSLETLGKEEEVEVEPGSFKPRFDGLGVDLAVERLPTIEDARKAFQEGSASLAGGRPAIGDEGAVQVVADVGYEECLATVIARLDNVVFSIQATGTESCTGEPENLLKGVVGRF